jgi:hypothetical protein
MPRPLRNRLTWIAMFLLGTSVANRPAEAADQAEFCKAVDLLAALAHDDFRQIDDGPDTTGDPWIRRTSFILPGAESCDLLKSDFGLGYWCRWPSTRQTVVRQTEAIVNRISGCLGGETDWINESETSAAFIVTHGVEFYVSGEGDDGQYDVVLAVEQIDDQPDPSSDDAPELQLVRLDRALPGG